MPSGEEPAANSPSGSDRKEKTEKPECRGHGRKPLPKSLERRRVVFELEESQRQCQHCHIPMQKIGEDVSERLEFIPASLQVIEEVRPKYACAKGCGVAAAPKPAAPIEKGLPGPGLLAHVAVSKYGDHLPALLRQRQRRANRSRAEHSDRQLQAATYRAFCLSSRPVRTHQHPSAPSTR